MASEKINAIIEEIKVLSVLELSELVHAVEEEFGVSAAAAVAVCRSGRWRRCCCGGGEDGVRRDPGGSRRGEDQGHQGGS